MKKIRDELSASVKVLWPDWNFNSRTILLCNLENNTLKNRFSDPEQLKVATKSLSSPPIIRSGKPKAFFADSKFNASNEVKEISNPAKVTGGLKVPNDADENPQPQPLSEV